MLFYPVKFAAIPKERIWGGNKLKALFKEKSEEPIGEYWVLSGHPNGTSIVVNGELKGKSLVDLTKQYPEVFLGNSPQDRFPLLIKFIEANDDLSVQVHPDDNYALKVEGDYGKTEAWYILGAKENGQVIFGHHFKNKEEYKSAIENKQIKDFLNYQKIEEDQLLYIPSGTIHALLSGTILIEVQQTSDITYRVYDWDRVDKNGKGRELHIEKAADVINYTDQTTQDETRHSIVATDSISHEQLVKSDYFVIEKIILENTAYQLQLGKEGNPDVLIIAEGEGTLIAGQEIETIALQAGDTLLVPTTIKNYEIQTKSKIKILRTYY
ncbi:mannose-6-phosphate isomerase [Vulcanibacillus modesticaldus]|uniref:Mannose-6-phosphate isomerase n=1 Tax=Vulcanibacillus modesticaldus TaxID=337097 RepID=A0A1D2YVQ8_9BACI|nr:type I phosphomannose isomerase catalytic subunit [Vulcanibacillus modesticaldus]OEF99800.1 mannose-6-phosphate isomerase [Vulcanibacillus modesticaldus]